LEEEQRKTVDHFGKESKKRAKTLKIFSISFFGGNPISMRKAQTKVE
jgi:hypothetical protein